MNEEQAEALKRVVEAGHPDAGTGSCQPESGTSTRGLLSAGFLAGGSGAG
jgi:hypothetical protein